MDEYLKALDEVPLLTRAEEIKLAKQARKRDCGKCAWCLEKTGADCEIREAAVSELVRRNLRLVVYIARKYVNRGLEFEDLVSWGNFGLFKAAKKYKWKMAKFSTYASWWIKQHIQRAIDDHSRLIRQPVYFKKIKGTVDRFILDFKIKNKREPQVEEITEALGYRPAVVRYAIRANVYTEPMFYLKGDLEESPVDLDEALDTQIQIDRLKGKITQLTKRQRLVIELRFLQDRPQTLKQVGRILGITREGVRQVQERALDSLREMCGENNELPASV